MSFGMKSGLEGVIGSGSHPKLGKKMWRIEVVEGLPQRSKKCYR